MVTVCQISRVDYNKYDEVWAVVRSLKYSNPRIRHVPELSPSWALFKAYLALRDRGEWNEDTFRNCYVPQFLKEMRGKQQQELLTELFFTKKRICIVCFCTKQSLCHTSILGGMLQGAGLEVEGLEQDYSFYYDWWRNGCPNTPIEQEKRITEYNSNVVYLHGDTKYVVFGDDVHTMCFTGRRPKDLCGYEYTKYTRLVSGLADLLYEKFYTSLGVRRFVTGGAQGFDQLSFWAVERMKKTHKLNDIENVVFVPFEQQESRWADTGCFSKTEYRLMLKHAQTIVVVCDDNSINSLFERNHAMCRNADYCLALYPDDSWTDARGGTAECMRYARDTHLLLFRLGYGKDKSGIYTGEVSACPWDSREPV